MSTLLEKISSYQIVNYLFPGICFVWLSDSLSLFKIPLFTDRIIENFFIYYFIDYGIIKDVTERYNYNREVIL